MTLEKWSFLDTRQMHIVTHGDTDSFHNTRTNSSQAKFQLVGGEVSTKPYPLAEQIFTLDCCERQSTVVSDMKTGLLATIQGRLHTWE